jgi:hypothetical protein
MDNFYSKGHVQIQGITLKSDRIALDEGVVIPWSRVATEDYCRCFAIYDRNNSSTHGRVSYNEYGTETLWSAIRRILMALDE